MKTRMTTCAAALLALFTLAGCAQHTPQDALNQQTVMSLDWFQQSGEYQALTHQAFNTAKVAFDNAPAVAGKKKAVIVDLDETMIDNSAYSAWQVKSGQAFTDATWSKWVQARQAKAIPGAVEFANYVNTHNGTMFYVSNRSNSDYQATADNLNKLGFSGVSPATLRLKTDSSNKQARFDAIAQQGYDIVLHIGDNLNDFGAATYHKDNSQRRDFVAANQAKFGTQLIVLPNPLYGDWESGLAKDFFKLTPAQQLEVRNQGIKPWDGK